jgi:hypothetical protein
MTLLSPTDETWVALSVPPDATPPELLMARLLTQLQERAPLCDLYTDYVEGRHALAFISTQYRRAFGAMLAGMSDNWMALIVQAAAQRLEVQALKGGGSDLADRQLLDLWRREGLELDSGLGFTAAGQQGEAYLLVEPYLEAGEARARITVEHPRQFIVERAPDDRRRLSAALKAWWDENAEALYVTLWTPQAIYRRSKRPSDSWLMAREDEALDVEANRLGRVPVGVLLSDPQMLPARPPLALLVPPHNAPDVAIGLGRSDIADFISTQDAIDQLLTNMLVSAEFQAFRQRWATGLEVPRDPDTGLPIQPFRAAVERVWVNEKPDGKFGEFAQTDLSNYTGALDWHVRSLASRSRIPPHILMSGSGNWPSGESLDAAETGMTDKVVGKQRSMGPGISVAMGYAAEIEGITVGSPRISLDWTAAGRRSESALADSLVKRLAIGVPPQQLWEDYGYSPEQISGFFDAIDQAREHGLAAGGAPAAAPAAVPPAPAPPGAPPPPTGGPFAPAVA